MFGFDSRRFQLSVQIGYCWLVVPLHLCGLDKSPGTVCTGSSPRAPPHCRSLTGLTGESPVQARRHGFESRRMSKNQITGLTGESPVQTRRHRFESRRQRNTLPQIRSRFESFFRPSFKSRCHGFESPYPFFGSKSNFLGHRSNVPLSV